MRYLVSSLIFFSTLFCYADDLTYKDGVIVVDAASKNFMQRMKSDPFVLQVRKDFDRFLKDHADKSHKTTSLEKDGFLKFAPEYFKSPYIVYYVAREQLKGGRTVTVLPVNKPDKLFDVWVYPASDGYRGIVYESRSISESPIKVDKKLSFTVHGDSQIAKSLWLELRR